MFEGKKTLIFWIGLIILGLASLDLFGFLWAITVLTEYGRWINTFRQTVPFIVGGVVFILIGFYMMKSGVRTLGKED